MTISSGRIGVISLAMFVKRKKKAIIGSKNWLNFTKICNCVLKTLLARRVTDENMPKNFHFRLIRDSKNFN